MLNPEIAYHGEEFRPPEEPVLLRLVSEDYVNNRELVYTAQTDHEMLQPLPAPGARASQMTYVFTERPFEIYDPSNTGAKVEGVPQVKPSPLQDQNPYALYHVNTLRIEALPWDEQLLG